MNHDRYISLEGAYVIQSFHGAKKKKNEEHLLEPQTAVPPSFPALRGCRPGRGSAHTCCFRALCSRDSPTSSPAPVMTAGSFQTGKEVVTQNPHFFQLRRKPSSRRRRLFCFLLGKAGSGRLGNPIVNVSLMLSDIQKMGVKVRWFKPLVFENQEPKHH